MESLAAPGVERVDDAFVLGVLFGDVAASQFEANRRAAWQC